MFATSYCSEVILKYLTDFPEINIHACPNLHNAFLWGLVQLVAGFEADISELHVVVLAKLHRR